MAYDVITEYNTLVFAYPEKEVKPQSILKFMCSSM